MPKKKTHEEYVAEVVKVNTDVIVIENYIGSDTKITHECKICHNTWLARPNDILKGHSCPICGRLKAIEHTRKRTQEQYIKDLKTINPDIELIDTYVDASTKIRHKCKKDEYEWSVAPVHVLRGRGCPKCGKTKKKTHEEHVAEMLIINPTVTVVGQYINNFTKIQYKCNICGYEWTNTPNSMCRGNNCPVCAHKAIGPPPEYKNSIWASEYKDLFSQYLTEEQMKNTTPNSHKKIEFVCPDCGKHKMETPNRVNNQHFACVCSDGISYPNKFMYAFLNQLSITYEIEKSFDWSKGKKYDIYIPSLQCIIENHGEQHYNGSFENIGGRTLKEEQQNDNQKEQLALKNNIKYYIIVDCRESSMKWIKNSILNSELNNLFNLKLINWEQCSETAASNLVKKTADLWNKGLAISIIAKQLNVVNSTIYTYLKKASECGMCNYTTEESSRRGKTLICGINNGRARPVIQFTLNGEYIKEWQCLTNVEKELGISSSTISSCINRRDKKSAGGFLWMSKENYEHIGYCKPYNFKTKDKEIVQLTLNNDFIKKWDKAITVKQKLKIDSSSIHKCCRGKINQTGGFKWMYYDEYITQQNNLNS